MNQYILPIFVILYLFITIGIWIYASRKVKNENDFLVAGRKLPIYIVIATVFATWFWSETVLWTSSVFLEEWLLWIMADPFWAALCLIIVSIFFARPMYRLWITTLWDFYKLKYGRTVEMLASICILVSYIWWVAAQIVALWIVFNVISFWIISTFMWAWIGASIVLIYTIAWWMWSIAFNDFVQMIMIVLGLLIATFFVTSGLENGMMDVVNHAIANSKFELFPEWVSFYAILWIIFALGTLWFWSIPQQDVFQRVLSARDEKTAVRWSIIGWSLYLIFAFIPIMLGYAAYLVNPELFERLGDTQLILPTLILESTPIFVQIVFFWALISAIMSTASATLLAPSALFTQNILKPFIKVEEKQLLKLTRFVVFWIFLLIMSFVTYKFNNEDANIFSMVEEAYKITLAWALFPLIAWIIIKKTHSISWLLSLISWIAIWLAMENINPDGFVPPQFWWFFASMIWFFIGQLLAKIYGFKDEK